MSFVTGTYTLNIFERSLASACFDFSLTARYWLCNAEGEDFTMSRTGMVQSRYDPWFNPWVPH